MKYYTKNVKISDNLHRLLKTHCSKNGLMINHYMEETLTTLLEATIKQQVELEQRIKNIADQAITDIKNLVK